MTIPQPPDLPAQVRGQAQGKPDSCKTCPLYQSDEGIVWGQGPSDAKMMFVGEAPGEDEGIQLIPFVGGAGRVLNAQLAHAGLRRGEVFVTNVVKCRPTVRNAQGQVKNRPPTETEIRHCARFLIHEIKTVNPNVIVALGNVPMKTLTGTQKGITLVRSVPTEGPRLRNGSDPAYYKVVGTFHPAAVMRAQDLWPAAVFDMVRARTESATIKISRRPWQCHIHASLSTHGEALRRRILSDRGYAYGYKPYFHDLETTGLDARTDTVRCIGIAAEPDEVFVFDWTVDVQRFIAELHASEELLTVGQNSEGFDIPFLEEKGIPCKGATFDTMIGWHQLNSGLPKDLDFIGASSTDELHWKDEHMYKAGEDALQGGCGKDVHATGRAFQDELAEMEKLGQLDLYFKHIMPLQPVLRNMRRRGVKKDRNRTAAWHVILNRKADELEVRLRKGLGDATFDVSSPKQLMDLLYRRMGLPVQYTKDGHGGFRPTVDADALDALALVTKNPIFTLVRSIRTLRKWDSTYVLCPSDSNSFIHGRISSAKAATGRLNHTEPNMANWPSEVRELVVPDSPDHVLISRDWSQIEWRLAMLLSGDRTGLAALVAKRDAHRDAYAEAYGRQYDEVTVLERYEAKFINYGLLYGRGDESIAAGRTGHPETAIPIDRVKDYILKFFRKFDGYSSYRDYLKRYVEQHHFIATAWGRRRWWYTRQLPEIYNFPMQGNAAHMMYCALIQIDKEAQSFCPDLLRLSVHDEVIMCCPRDQKTLKLALECSRDVMEQQFPQIVEHSRYPDVVKHFYPDGWYCETDWHVGETWRACKPESPKEKEDEKELRKVLGI